MPRIFLNPSEQGIVEFMIWKSLEYKKRLTTSLCFILAGLLIQYFTFDAIPGVAFILLGNLLLLPSGYTNKVDLGFYDPNCPWEKVDTRKLDELIEFDRKIRKWDLSSIDASNILGGFVFLIAAAATVFIASEAFENRSTLMAILAIDAAVLVLPYWITGLRAKFTIPKVILRAKLLKKLLIRMEPYLKKHTVDCYFCMKGKEKRIPIDIKFRVNIAGQHKDFLGLYGQITLNDVSGKDFPFFYAVLVARKGYDLEQGVSYEDLPEWSLYEHKTKKDVEVLVILQDTDFVSRGYTTNNTQTEALFLAGLRIAEKAAVRKG